MDCNGECNIDTPTSCEGTNCGTAVIDDCGVCTLGTTGVAFNQDIDCNGECFGEAIIDNCGECAGGSTGLGINYLMDCAGVCNGDAIETTFFSDNDGDGLGDPDTEVVLCGVDGLGGYVTNLSLIHI